MRRPRPPEQAGATIAQGTGVPTQREQALKLHTPMRPTRTARNGMQTKGGPSHRKAQGGAGGGETDAWGPTTMRAVLQRVTQARVVVDQEVVGEIGRGLLVLLGVTHGDTVEQARWLADKIIGLRIFND